jgi:hypothetical protein
MRTNSYRRVAPKQGLAKIGHLYCLLYFIFILIVFESANSGERVIVRPLPRCSTLYRFPWRCWGGAPTHCCCTQSLDVTSGAAWRVDPVPDHRRSRVPCVIVFEIVNVLTVATLPPLVKSPGMCVGEWEILGYSGSAVGKREGSIPAGNRTVVVALKALCIVRVGAAFRGA